MELTDLINSKIIITGGSGFLGRHLYKSLINAGCKNVIPYGHRTSGPAGTRHYWVNLLSGSSTGDMFWHELPDYVFHLAGYNGGIQFNLDKPFDILLKNSKMAQNVLKAAIKYKTKKVVSVVASCAYPEWDYTSDKPNFQMFEPDFFTGPPHDSVACHGYAKRHLQLLSAYANKQYGLEAVCACPTTLYGPGDSYDPERTKVMGGMIKRFVDAVNNGDQEVTVWGTGRPMREFLFVKDAADLLIKTMLYYDRSDTPINLGTGQELTIKSLAETVAKIVGFTGNINFDTSKKDGQYRKRLHLTRMKSFFGDNYLPTPLEDGIKQTINDYAKYDFLAGVKQ